MQRRAPRTCPQQRQGVSGLQGGRVEPNAGQPPAAPRGPQAGPSRARDSASVPWALEPEAAAPLPSGHSGRRGRLRGPRASWRRRCLSSALKAEWFVDAWGQGGPRRRVPEAAMVSDVRLAGLREGLTGFAPVFISPISSRWPPSLPRPRPGPADADEDRRGPRGLRLPPGQEGNRTRKETTAPPSQACLNPNSCTRGPGRGPRWKQGATRWGAGP